MGQPARGEARAGPLDGLRLAGRGARPAVGRRAALRRDRHHARLRRRARTARPPRGGVLMLSRVITFAIDGVAAKRVWVEADIRLGLPTFTIVGLADKAVREARERVRAALVNSGYEFPSKRITVNLAPAALRKIGPGFDLPLALALLVASDQLDPAALDACAVVGELSLTGDVRSVRGVLACAEGTRRHGLERIVVPWTRA